MSLANPSLVLGGGPPRSPQKAWSWVALVFRKGEHQYLARPRPVRPPFLMHKEKVPSHCSLQLEQWSLGTSLGGERGAASTAPASSFPGALCQAAPGNAVDKALLGRLGPTLHGLQGGVGRGPHPCPLFF